MRRATLVFALAGIAAATVSWSSPPPPSEKAGLAAFETVLAVLQHPRCQNCHIPGDAPLEFDASLTHTLNVKRGPDGKGAPGLKCATCHAASNPPASYGMHMPPGAPDWHLPPPEKKMIFIDLTSAELCRNLKDSKFTGGRDLAALTKHVESDKLVLWGWQPGFGRDAVPVPHAEFVAKFKEWVSAGAPCPAK
jgi:hypothetical protein